MQSARVLSNICQSEKENVREKVIVTTANISNRIAGFVEKGREINTTLQDASEKVKEIDAKIEELKAELRQ